MKPLYKQPLIEGVILASGILCTVVLIHGVQNWIALSGQPPAPQIAEKSNPDLVQVAAGSGCPYSANVSLGLTAGGGEMRTNPSKDVKVYDPFSQYRLNADGTKEPGKQLVGTGPSDLKLPVIGTMFGYKPTKVNFYKVLEDDGTPVPAPWLQYLIGVPTEVGTDIKAPKTGYDIGGGKMGLVLYATADQITIHVGRHEYLTGNGGSESGGYWIYLKGLCVNTQIVDKYNANATSRTQLPELSQGEIIGKAAGAEVLIAVRDNGPFQDILAQGWWSGVSEINISPPAPITSTVLERPGVTITEVPDVTKATTTDSQGKVVVTISGGTSLDTAWKAFIECKKSSSATAYFVTDKFSSAEISDTKKTITITSATPPNQPFSGVIAGNCSFFVKNVIKPK